MQTLYLVRHAKSDWNNTELLDIERPLNARGYRDAHFMSNWLKKQKIIPELFISSNAIRAISTALIFSKNLEMDSSKIMIEPKLYETNEKQYLKLIHAIDNKVKTAIIFAHNPTLTLLANYLAKPFTENIPTCGIVGLRINNNHWKGFDFQKAELFLYEYPKKSNYLF
jgi:phosphohistidine phosphatase